MTDWQSIRLEVRERPVCSRIFASASNTKCIRCVMFRGHQRNGICDLYINVCIRNVIEIIIKWSLFVHHPNTAYIPTVYDLRMAT